MRNFNNIELMVYKFNKFGGNIDELMNLDAIDFMALIYQLDTGRFECNGFSNISFLRYIMSSSDSSNWALDIVNNLVYCKSDFLDYLL